MQIHVVRSGDSLYSIAHAYGVPVSSVLAASQPPNPDHLVPGQTILIPTPETGTRPVKEINAYLVPKGNQSDVAMVQSLAHSLTYLSIFSYQVQHDGSLLAPNDTLAVNAAIQNNITPILVATNFSNGRFNSDIARMIFRDQTKQNQFFTQIFATMRQKGYRVINIDFEYIYPEDREHYNQFLRNLMARAKPAGYLVATALAPKSSATQQGLLYEAHDYAAHGQIVDFSILMTYEWGWSGGPPMAVAPIPDVRRVLDYAVTVMPRNKIMMGMPLYGYDWTLPYVPGGHWARLISTQQAYIIAAQKGVNILYDNTSQAPHYAYQDAGRSHVIWFEDARSMDAKFQIIKEYNLRGGSYWELGTPFPQNWSLLASRFQVRKL